MSERRVVITGLGTINPLGLGTSEYFENLLAGKSGVKRISAFEPGEFPSQAGGEAPDFKVNSFVPKSHRKAVKLMSRDIALAVIAADDAVRNAGLKTKGTAPDDELDIEPTRSGVNIGAGLICCDLVELGSAAGGSVVDGKFSLKHWGAEGMNSLTPLWLLKYLPNMLNCHISLVHDLQGPSNSITCAEASGLLAIGESYYNILRGRCDVMVAGGAESKINAMSLLRQCLINRVSTKYNDTPEQACRPFDKDADGTVMAEGGGVVVLEELEHALKRGAKIYGEIKGFGASSNFTDDFVKPEADGRGIQYALKGALEQSGLKAEDISLLVPHGVGSADEDAAEAYAINAVFGEHTQKLSVLATKSRIGNAGAGAAAVDFVTAMLAMDAGKIPQTLNCPNKAVDLNLTTEGVREAAIDNLMTCCHTYGGQTAALVVSKYK